MEISLENLYLTALCIIHGHEVKRSAESCETDYLNYFHLSSSGKNISVMVTKKIQIFSQFHKLMVRSVASLSKMESSHIGYSTIIKVIE